MISNLGQKILQAFIHFYQMPSPKKLKTTKFI